MPRTNDGRLAMQVWSAAAACSVVVAASIAVQPGYMADLTMVRQWLQHLQEESGNPYRAFGDLDYPPHALLVLSPLGWVADSDVAVLYIPCAIASMVAATWMLTGWAARQFGVNLSPRDRAVLVMLALAGSSLRSALWRGQLAPLAFLFGAAALHWSSRRPILAAAMLAFCAFKPHVALGFGLAALVTSGGAVLYVAGALVLAASWWFAAATENPVSTMWQSYVVNLAALYDGPDRIRGLMSVRWVIEDLVGSYELGTMMYLAAAAVTSVILLDAALATTDRRQRARVAVAFMVWALVFLPHQLYHGWMAAPALWLMMWPESGLIRNDRVRAASVAGFVLFGALDISRIIRLLIDEELNWPLAWTTYMLAPLRMTLIFALLLWVIVRDRSAPQPRDIAAVA